MLRLLFSDFFRNYHTPGYIRCFVQTLLDQNEFTYYNFALKIPLRVCPPSMRLRFVKQKYEVPERTLVNSVISEKDRILELGGCIGYISLLASSIIKHDKHVVLEINETLITTLKEHAKLNNAKYQVLYGFLGEKPGFINLARKMTTSRIHLTKGTQVPNYSLDEIERIYNLQFNTLICDIEGGEFELIESKVIYRFNKIIIEWHNIDDKYNATFGRNKLVESGFKLVRSIGLTDYFKKNS